MNKIFTTIPLMVLTLFFVTCSKEIQQVEPIELDQQSQFELTEIERPENFDLEVYEAFYWGRGGHKLRENRKKQIKVLRAEIKAKKSQIFEYWNGIVEADIVEADIDISYLLLGLNFEWRFHKTRKDLIEHLTKKWDNGRLRNKFDSEYECNEVVYLKQIYEKPNFNHYNKDIVYGKVSWNTITENTRLYWPNGELTLLRKLKNKNVALDVILRTINWYSPDNWYSYLRRNGFSSSYHDIRKEEYNTKITNDKAVFETYYNDALGVFNRSNNFSVEWEQVNGENTGKGTITTCFGENL